VSAYTVSAGAGGKVIDALSVPVIRTLVFRAILAGCAKALAG
jgi:hypothetical protein